MMAAPSEITEWVAYVYVSCHELANLCRLTTNLTSISCENNAILYPALEMHEQ